MPTDARSRTKDVDARMPVGQADDFPYVDIKAFADEGYFIGKAILTSR
jgi:hypothetical protein